MSKLIRSLVVCVCNLFLVVLSGYAQQNLGSINGTVFDTSGAVLQKAAVRIRNLATNDERTILTKSLPYVARQPSRPSPASRPHPQARSAPQI
jgi:hypothetical protein